MRAIQVKAGEVFERWTVIAEVEKRSRHRVMLCRCECGVARRVLLNGLRMGTTKSCGCLLRETNTKHGLHQTVEYRTWAHMNYRCSNPNSQGWKNYGGRGIVVCEKWRKSFQIFLEDVGPRPSRFHSLDRWPNNDGNYEPGNVRWATRSEQRLNKRPVIWERCLMLVALQAGVSESDVRRMAEAGRSDIEIAQWIARCFKPTEGSVAA